MLRWLNWLWPRSRLEAGPAKWTRDRLGWLIGQFGWERLLTCPVVLPTPDFFPDRYDGSEDAARLLFQRTCGYMHIDPAGVELIFHFPVHRAGFTGKLVREEQKWAGLYQAGADKKTVRIDGALLPDPETLVATYAHELAHFVLLGEERISADDPDHELVTDLTTVFFGLGVFNANMAYRDKFVENRRGDSVQTLGYLTPPIWSYALAVFASLRDEQKPAWTRYLRTAVRSPCEQAIADFAGGNRPQLVVGGQLDSATRAVLLHPQYPWLAGNSQEDDLPDDQNQPDDIRENGVREPDARENDTDETAAGAETDASPDDTDGSPNDTDDSSDGHFSPDCTADDLFSQGLAYSNQRQWAAAVLAFSAAIKKSPRDGEAYQKRAWAKFEQAQYLEALEDGMSAVHFSPDDSESFLVRGAAALQVGQFDMAIADLTHYISAESGHQNATVRPSRGCYFRGLAHCGRRDWKRAVTDFSTAIRFFADWPEPYEARAQAYEQLGKPAQASTDRATALRRAGGPPAV